MALSMLDATQGFSPLFRRSRIVTVPQREDVTGETDNLHGSCSPFSTVYRCNARLACSVSRFRPAEPIPGWRRYRTFVQFPAGDLQVSGRRLDDESSARDGHGSSAEVDPAVT